jgi:hypothetical protein
MKLATFDAGDGPRAGEVRGEEVVEFTSGTSRPATAPRPTAPPTVSRT